MSYIEGDDLENRQDAEVPEAYAEHPAWIRLEDQIDWHDKKGVLCQRLYKWLALAQIGATVLIPPIGFIDAVYSPWLIAFLAMSVAILEGIQKINRYHELWVTYRATAERLKREKNLFQSAAGPYRNLEEPDKLILLAEQIDSTN